MADKFLLQLREHEYSATFPPSITFSKPDGLTLRIRSNSGSYIGQGLGFLVLPRTWLDTKTLSLTWSGYSSFTSCTASVDVRDGSYDRTSATDFPPQAAIPSKGAGILYNGLFSRSNASWSSETRTQYMDLSGALEDYVTVFLKVRDAAETVQGYMNVTELKFTSGGITYGYADIAGSITMEVTGGVGDYGYCGETITWTDNYLVDRGRSRTRTGLSYSSGGGWERNS